MPEPAQSTDRESSRDGTDPVDVRQQLAADRTLLAWIRTAVPLAALGFVVARFNLLEHQLGTTTLAPSGASRWIGAALIALAAATLALGLLQHVQVHRMLAEHGDLIPTARWPGVAASAGCLLVIVALGIYLIIKV
jgi:putative membrane protein